MLLVKYGTVFNQQLLSSFHAGQMNLQIFYRLFNSTETISALRIPVFWDVTLWKRRNSPNISTVDCFHTFYDAKKLTTLVILLWFLCYSYRTYSYNEYSNQFMLLVKYIQKSKTPVKLLHVSAPTCHHQGLILTKEYKTSTFNRVLCRLH